MKARTIRNSGILEGNQGGEWMRGFLSVVQLEGIDINPVEEAPFDFEDIDTLVQGVLLCVDQNDNGLVDGLGATLRKALFRLFEDMQTGEYAHAVDWTRSCSVNNNKKTNTTESS